MKPIRNIVGPVPDPDELFGREALIENLWRQLDGNNVLLLAPRRFGKTGIMRHALLRPQEGFVPVYLDLEDVDTPSEFVWRITQALLQDDRWRSFLQGAKGLPKTLQDWVKDTFDEVGFSEAKLTFKASVEASWEDVARRLLATLESAPQRALLLLDELPSMLENLQRNSGEEAARKFLAWFRTVRLKQKDTLRRHRFIVAGSIGIDVILRALKATDKMNDFTRIAVEPIHDTDARVIIRSLGLSIDLKVTAELEDELLRLIGSPVPYFIHLFFSELGQLPPSARRQIDVGALQKIYETRVQGPACKRYFDHYRDRLSRFGSAGEKAAVAILSAIVSTPQGRVSESALFTIYKKSRKSAASDLEFTELMNDLECDWYLVLEPSTNEYYFMVKVIADWWKRWFTRRPLKSKS